MMLSAAVVAGVANLVDPDTPLTMLHHLAAGSLLFGALVVFIRLFSNYPEGVVFAVLLMNAFVPLINRWTIPQPFGAREAAATDGGQA